MLNHMNGKINNWKDLLEEYQDVLNYSFDLSNVQFADLLYNNPNYLTLKDPMQIEYKGIKLCIISKD